MKLASVLTPPSFTNLRLAAQCGVEGIVIRYPGPELATLRALKEQIEDHGMQVCAIEGYLPIERIKLGQDDQQLDLNELKQLLCNMAELGLDVLCYNFMAGTDWVRTRVDAPERGGAKVTAFSLADAERAVSLNHRPADRVTTIDAATLWINLERFLNDILPLAEKCGVKMCMHPDDPPLPEFMGKARILNCVESCERLVQLVDSPSNKICFCSGTFATMGVDIPQTIRRLGSSIGYVHFRDVRGNSQEFAETFHDNGPTDMAEAIRALREIGFTGYMRPDHVPQLEGEDDGEPGYTMLGRLFAFGYIRGLLHGTQA